MTMNVTQEALRIIAKLSNFNVDLQAKTSIVGPMCRAICTVCKADIPIDMSVLSRGSSFDGEFEKFCKDHRHEVQVAIVEEVVGRKFKW